jgi:hypothetical protein
VTSFFVAIALCTITVCGFLLAFERTLHWFVVPVWCCGVLMGRDAVDWFRGRLDLLDPAGAMGAMGVHFFFLAPLLHVAWDSWLLYVEPPPDWRDWVGGMALVNVVGLVLYLLARESAGTRAHRNAPVRVWQIDRRRFAFAAACALAVSAALQASVYVAYGGVFGYIQAFTETIGAPQSESAFTGMGWIFMMSESFPIVAMMLFAVLANRTRVARSWLVIIVVLLAYFVLALLFGGLKGSRSHTIWGLFWAAGIIHLWIRPLTRRFIAAGICFVIAFMYVYGFYKELGRDAMTLYQQAQLELDEERGRTWKGLLLGDLARADVQAFLLYRLTTADRDYYYALGRTYIGSIALLIPRRIWPDRPLTKVLEGTEAQYGVGSYDPDEWSSSNVYGVAGEAMLNFGPVAVPFAYLMLGLIVGRARGFLSRLDPGDARWLLCPFIVNLCIAVLHADSDNLLFTFVKDGMVPLSVLWLGHVKGFRGPRTEREPLYDGAPARV